VYKNVCNLDERSSQRKLSSNANPKERSDFTTMAQAASVMLH
jgi:hypothetical protein